VSVGTATVAMVLNGLGFSNRRLYLVPQFFENKPVQRLLGDGVRRPVTSTTIASGVPSIDSMSTM